MAFIPIRGLIALLSLIFAGSGVAFAVMSTVDTDGTTEPAEQLAFFDDDETAPPAPDPSTSLENRICGAPTQRIPWLPPNPGTFARDSDMRK